MRIFLPFLLFVVMLAWNPAYAYVDPGTASIAVQSIIAAIAAVSILFRRVRSTVVNIITHLVARFRRIGTKRNGK